MPGRKSLLSLPFSPAHKQRGHGRGHTHGNHMSLESRMIPGGKGRDLPGTPLLGEHKEREQMGRRALTGQEFHGASHAAELCL